MLAGCLAQQRQGGVFCARTGKKLDHLPLHGRPAVAEQRDAFSWGCGRAETPELLL